MGRIFTEKEEGFCSKMVGFSLLIRTSMRVIVPNLEVIIRPVYPLLIPEIGNLLPVFVAIPLAVKFGFGRRAIGAWSS